MLELAQCENLKSFYWELIRIQQLKLQVYHLYIFHEITYIIEYV